MMTDMTTPFLLSFPPRSSYPLSAQKPMTRPLIADPGYVNKLRENRFDEIRMQTEDLKRQLSELNREIALERSLWRRRVRRGRLAGLGLGLVLGFGSGYLVRRNNP